MDLIRRPPHLNNPLPKPRRLLYLLAVYVVPIFLLLLATFTFLQLESVYPTSSGTPIPIRALPTTANTALDPATALSSLHKQPSTLSAPTGNRTWLLADIPAQYGTAELLLEFSTRHASEISCWNPITLEPLVANTSAPQQSPLLMRRLGFTVSIWHEPYAQQVLCHGHFSQNAPISAQLWQAANFNQMVRKFDFTIGWLEGGLLIPALLLVLISYIVRDTGYALLGVWLVANLRLGAYALGWDTQWLGYYLPLEAMPAIRKLTAVAYYALTVGLLLRLLHQPRQEQNSLLPLLKAATFSMVAVTPFLPALWFWPTLGVLSLLTLGTTFVLLYQQQQYHHLLSWFWQILSLCMAFSLLTGLSMLQVFGDINTLNKNYTVFLLFASTLAMTLTLVERVRNTRTAQARLQTELVTTYTITPIGFFTLNQQGQFLRMNRVMEDVLGVRYSPAEPAYWHDFFEDIPWNDIHARTLANEDIEISASKNSVLGKNRHFVIRAVVTGKTVEGSLQDISAHTALIEQLRIMAGKDPVTETLNLRAIEGEIQNAIVLCKQGVNTSLGLLNLSQFKNINSLFGYNSGDIILKETGQTIRNILPHKHQLGRIGGDEFAIVFPNLTASQVLPSIQKLITALNSRSFNLGPHSVNVKAAVGLIDLNVNINSPKEALFTVGQACRDASKHPDRLVSYAQGSAPLNEHRKLLHLFDLLETGQTPPGFRIELQPMLSLQNQIPAISFEVLLRVEDSNGKPLNTGRVIAAAEDIGPITTIDKWVIENTLAWLDEHSRKMPQLDLITLNISGVSLNSNAFTQHLFRLLDRYKHLAHKLIIEMTEGVALENLARSQQITQQLQKIGVRVALDDFGSGYTSFSYLRKLKANVIKIDGSLIQNMLADKNSTAIVQTIIQLASHMDMKCIAEWVEDIDTMEALYKMGVDYIQGYIVSKSISQDAALAIQSIEDALQTPEARDFVRRVLPRQMRP